MTVVIRIRSDGGFEFHTSIRFPGRESRDQRVTLDPQRLGGDLNLWDHQEGLEALAVFAANAMWGTSSPEERRGVVGELGRVLWPEQVPIPSEQGVVDVRLELEANRAAPFERARARSLLAALPWEAAERDGLRFNIERRPTDGRASLRLGDAPIDRPTLAYIRSSPRPNFHELAGTALDPLADEQGSLSALGERSGYQVRPSEPEEMTAEALAAVLDGAQILHVTAHGHRNGRQYVLLWCGDDPTPTFVSGATLVEVIRGTDHDLRVVVLAACSSDATVAGSTYASLAEDLFEVVPVVVAFAAPILDESAEGFIELFYPRLRTGGLQQATDHVRARWTNAANDRSLMRVYSSLASGHVLGERVVEEEVEGRCPRFGLGLGDHESLLLGDERGVRFVPIEEVTEAEAAQAGQLLLSPRGSVAVLASAGSAQFIDVDPATGRAEEWGRPTHLPGAAQLVAVSDPPWPGSTSARMLLNLDGGVVALDGPAPSSPVPIADQPARAGVVRSDGSHLVLLEDGTLHVEGDEMRRIAHHVTDLTRAGLESLDAVDTGAGLCVLVRAADGDAWLVSAQGAGWVDVPAGATLLRTTPDEASYRAVAPGAGVGSAYAVRTLTAAAPSAERPRQGLR